MKKLYYVRHGQTVLNLEYRVCGITESELTEKGILQAKETGLTIKNALESGKIAGIDQVLCSPLKRTMETAKYICDAAGLTFKVDERLIEQNFGKYEAQKRTPEFEALKACFAQDFGGGESTLKVCQRVYNFLDEIKNDDKIYLIVAHGGLSRAFNSYFNNLTNEEYGKFLPENGSILEFDL